MRRFLLLIAAAWLAYGPAAIAAPAEQADCPFDALTPQGQLQLGDVALATMTGDTKNGPPKAAVNAANGALSEAIMGCAKKFGWSENDASNAVAYTTLRSMLIITRSYIEKMGGDPNVAELFYAQNKYKILDESAAERSSEAWAKVALEQLGFARKGSQAYDVAWFHLGLMFQQDDMRTAFIEGKTAIWSSEPVKQ